MELKERIEKVLSEILSDKHEAKITIKFEKPDPGVATPRKRTASQKKGA
jgi:hypothetical protein